MDKNDLNFSRDIGRINQIPIIPVLLEVICQTTGLGFAAVARVTDSRWITCCVRDESGLGLVQGSELRIETTICNEIRDSQQPVIIENVQQNKLFRNHQMLSRYGFQSYISYPIILKTGEFFGTLCAIDKRPAQLENTKVMGMFTAFADLISFHLQQIESLEQSNYAVKSLSLQLTNMLDENRQFRHVSSHTLQEPLRKLQVFSTMLIDAIGRKDAGKAEHLALRIKKGAERFSSLIKELSRFSDLQDDNTSFQRTDLKYIVEMVKAEFLPKLQEKESVILVGALPVIRAVPKQIEELFYHLLDNAVKFSKQGVPLEISVSCSKYTSGMNTQFSHGNGHIEIEVRDNGLGIDLAQQEKIFDMFSQLPSQTDHQGVGMGLTICRKIIRNHAGTIKIKSQKDIGTSVSVILPTE